MEFKLHNGSGGLCCKSCGRQDKQLNTYDWLADIPGNAEESEMVEIQFKNTRKGYFRNSNKIPLEKGDIVAVEATPGHDIGVVTLTGRLVPLQMRKANIKSEADIKRIYRKAKQVDMDKYNEAKAREHSTMIRARQIALDLNLNMKIGDVEYQGDGNKAIFYYIADERVDFRQLIKVLADAFHVRIEMKQIGARQEAGRIGAAKSDYLWIVDPIDGTLNFMHGIPQYAVSIALAYRGEVVAGVIYDVAKNELFTAAKGEGAFLDNRRIRVSDRKDMNRAVIGTGFPFRRSDDFKGYMMSFMRVAERTAGIRRPGSAALDLAWVAAGRYDGFWEFSLKPWDVAAGGLIVLEAGGLITDLTGGEEWLETGNVCAGNPKIFAQLLPLVGKLPVNTQTEAAQNEKVQIKNDKVRRTLSTKKA